jgi:hypothetical protein
MADQPEQSRPKRRRKHPPLPMWLKIVLIFIGWLVLLVGVAGLVLPGIQGILTIVVGAAILSVASERIYFGIRLMLRRRPKTRRRLDKFRHWMHERLTRHKD